MRIGRIDVFRVAMPLVYPFRTAAINDYVIESILVRLEAGELYGWGESSPGRFPGYSPEFAAGAFLAIRDVLAPRLLGQEIETGEQLQACFSDIKGNYFAKAALDLAWWDLHAKTLQKPLYRVLGGQRSAVEIGADFGVMENIGLLLKAIDEAVRGGFRRVKLKYRPGWDLPMIDAVRKTFQNLTIHVDCNSAYTLADLDMLKKLDQYHLAMIEQPLMHDDLADHAVLQQKIETPICLDESITSESKARKAIQLKSCRWINIKPGRVGGLTNALRIHDLCANAGIPCWVGGMLESAVGASHCLALASLPNIRYPSDIFPSSRFYAQDLSVPEMVLSGHSTMTLAEAPGVGAQPMPERLEKSALERWSAVAQA